MTAWLEAQDRFRIYGEFLVAFEGVFSVYKSNFLRDKSSPYTNGEASSPLGGS